MTFTQKIITAVIALLFALSIIFGLTQRDEQLIDPTQDQATTTEHRDAPTTDNEFEYYYRTSQQLQSESDSAPVIDLNQNATIITPK